MRKFLLFPVFAALAALSCSDDMPCVTCNSIEKQPAPEYKDGYCDIKDTIQIGDQIWMAENYSCYAPGSKCYDNIIANCEKYGLLYSWETAKDICPEGWHIPNKADWKKFIDYDGEGKYDYFAILGGKGYSLGGNDYFFLSVEETGFWWSDDDKYNRNSAYQSISNAAENYHAYSYADGKSMFSVRCLQD